LFFPRRNSKVLLLNATIHLLLDQIKFSRNISKLLLKTKDISIILSTLQVCALKLVTGHLISGSCPPLSSPNPIKHHIILEKLIKKVIGK